MSIIEILLTIVAIAEVASVYAFSKHSEKLFRWNELVDQKRSKENERFWDSAERLIEDRISHKFSEWSPAELKEIKSIDLKAIEAQTEQAKEAKLAYEAAVKEKEAELKLIEVKLKLKERELAKVEALAKMQEKRDEQ